ncbi:cell adhesion molecule CEACAM8-like isoform X2 [Dendrobates tinctorius]|uniref:cell adhesion molecule CEACAM8-like isoform X2 n=1 Tax=Dendrobates tinctorius TaxID=92724 RepID=UPI003CCA5D7F
MRGYVVTVLFILTMDVTSGQISIQQIPQYPLISGSVTLSIIGITEKIKVVSWYKGRQARYQNQILSCDFARSPPLLPGPLYNERFSAFGNGSLHITELHISDGGNYPAYMLTETLAKIEHLKLNVYDPVTKPKITASINQPKENEALTLTCNTLQAVTIRWTRNGGSVPSGAKLSKDNKGLTFSSIKRGDSGEYRCEAENIANGPDKAQIEGAAFVSLGSSTTLTCSAESVPPPEYQWQHNDTDLQEKTNKYNINNALPEDEGQYMCAAKNPVTLRTATDSFYVNVTAAFVEGYEDSTGLILGVFFGTILGVALIIILSVFLYRKIIAKKTNDSLQNKLGLFTVSENVKAAQTKEDSFYMGLQFRTEDTYTELKI